MFLARLVLIWLACLAQGCLLHQSVPIRSSPSGATVLVDGVVIGRTPIDVSLWTTSDHEVYVVADGYIQERVTLRSESRTTYYSYQVPSSQPGGRSTTRTGSTTSYWLVPKKVSVQLQLLPKLVLPQTNLANGTQLVRIELWLESGLISASEAEALRWIAMNLL